MVHPNANHHTCKLPHLEEVRMKSDNIDNEVKLGKISSMVHHNANTNPVSPITWRRSVWMKTTSIPS